MAEQNLFVPVRRAAHSRPAVGRHRSGGRPRARRLADASGTFGVELERPDRRRRHHRQQILSARRDECAVAGGSVSSEGWIRRPGKVPGLLIYSGGGTAGVSRTVHVEKSRKC